MQTRIVAVRIFPTLQQMLLPLPNIVHKANLLIRVSVNTAHAAGCCPVLYVLCEMSPSSLLDAHFKMASWHMEPAHLFWKCVKLHPVVKHKCCHLLVCLLTMFIFENSADPCYTMQVLRFQIINKDVASVTNCHHAPAVKISDCCMLGNLCSGTILQNCSTVTVLQ